MKLLRRRQPALLDVADAQATRTALAQHRTTEMEAQLERTRLEAKIREESAAAERRAAREQAEAAREADRTARQDAKRRKEESAAERKERRAKRRETTQGLVEQLRPIAPILVVNAGALFGQIGYGTNHYSPAGWNPIAKVAVAVVVALAAETIALYVGWHAHDALLQKATSTASKLRRRSYLIAGVIAGVNYVHFCENENVLKPTGASIVFAMFSLLSPWLWGLHTRRAQHLQLKDEGRTDEVGAIFSLERWKAFPLLTRQARRWSIYHGITDPASAWKGFNAERDVQRRFLAAQPMTGRLAKLFGLTARARVLAGAALAAEAERDRAEQLAQQDRQRADQAEQEITRLTGLVERMGAELEEVRNTATAAEAAATAAQQEAEQMNLQVETLNYQLNEAVTGRRIAEQRAASAERSAHRAEAELRSRSRVGASARASNGDTDSEPAPAAAPSSAPPASSGTSAAEESASKEERRKALIARFTENPALQLDYKVFAREQGISPRTARRDIADAKRIVRRNWIRQELATRPQLSPADIAGRFRITEDDAREDLAAVAGPRPVPAPAPSTEDQRPRLVG